MIRKKTGWSAVAALALSLCTSAPFGQEKQQEITVHLDPSRTEIRWTLSDVLHTVHGTFKLKGGVVTFDPATGAAEGELLVDLESGESGNKTRDRLMRKNVFQTDTYPQAIYHPEKISGTLQPGAAQQLTVDGTFTIHGKDHPLRLIVQAQLTGSNQVVATTRFAVPYVAWGMKDPSTFVLRVGKQADVDVTARGYAEGLP
jgi:polyisoprenoid-binding protein YceI